MSNNIHPNLRAALDNMSEEQIAKILNTEYSASDIVEQAKRLEQIKEQLCNPKEVTIEGWVTRSKNGKIVFSDSPECKRGKCVWYHKEGSNIVTLSETGLFDEDILPSITWGSDPKRVKITITPIEE